MVVFLANKLRIQLTQFWRITIICCLSYVNIVIGAVPLVMVTNWYLSTMITTWSHWISNYLCHINAIRRLVIVLFCFLLLLLLLKCQVSTPMGYTPHLKMKTPHLKNTPPPPIETWALFHEMIPWKSTINTNLKSS